MRLNAVWNKESDEYIRFVNPGDFRAADLACGKYEREVMWMKKSMMTHGGMLWGAALYNNGAYPMKDSNFGESYGKDGKIQGLLTGRADARRDQEERHSALPDAAAAMGNHAAGNVLRVFERGGEEERSALGHRQSEHFGVGREAGSQAQRPRLRHAAAPTRSFWD